MTNQLHLYGIIGSDVRSVDVKKTLLAMDQTQPLVVKIDSEGGSVLDGFSIANAIQAYAGPKKAIVEPQAFSIASYIVSVFDEVEIVSNGYIMAHFPYDETGGTAEELSGKAVLLADIEQKMVARYIEKTGKSEDEVRALLRSEKFLNAEESVAMGLATSIADVTSRPRTLPTAKHRDMPTKVYASLFGSAGLGGEDRETTEGKKPMSNATPVAATVQEIKAAYPKAKDSFIVKCLEKSLPLASVASAAAEELMAENEELMAKVAAMEEEMVALRAKAEQMEEPAAMEEESEDEVEVVVSPSAKAKGAKPIAGAARTSTVSATARWDEAVKAEVTRGLPRIKAVIAANRKNPGLRDQMLAEANS